ncbi:unnamed protein product [Urochloa humidicola]
MLDWDSLRVAAGGVDIRPYFDQFPGLVSLVSERNLYIPEWVRVVYATFWIIDNRTHIGFMFQEKAAVLGRGFLATRLGVELYDRCLHSLAWPGFLTKQNHHVGLCPQCGPPMTRFVTCLFSRSFRAPLAHPTG